MGAYHFQYGCSWRHILNGDTYLQEKHTELDKAPSSFVEVALIPKNMVESFQDFCLKIGILTEYNIFSD